MSLTAKIRRKIAVGVSGSGRSLENLIRVQGHFSFEVAVVIASSTTCGANQIALQNKIPLMIADFATTHHDDLEKKIKKFLKINAIELIVLAGFLKKFPIIKDFKDKIINIHPALLPLHGGPGMYGLRVHQLVIDSGAKESGATVHWVNAHYDEGGIIAQGTVAVEISDSAEDLARRVFDLECILLPKTIDEIFS